MAPLVKKPLSSRLNWKLLTFALIIIIAAVITVLELTDTTHFFHKSDAAAKVVVKAGRPTPVPKNNVSKGTVTPAKDPNANAGLNSNAGGAKDTGGTTSASTDSSKWVISQSGNITVKQPIANATLKSGGVLSGSSKLEKVNFRLIDSSVGVIAQGTLTVVNGNFSGTLNFTPHSSSGRLDVFSTDDQGVELNEVQISVGF